MSVSLPQGFFVPDAAGNFLVLGDPSLIVDRPNCHRDYATVA